MPDESIEKIIVSAQIQQTTHPEAAIKKYFHALYLHPDAIELQFGKAITNPPPIAPISEPMWQKENLHNKSICVWMQKGLGDQLQFVRFVLLLEKMGAKVTLFCPKTVQILFAHSFPNMHVVSDKKELKKYDYQCPLLALPHLLQVNPSKIPYKQGYLSAKKTKDFSHLFDPEKIAIGIVFTGDPNHPHNVDRSIALSEFSFLKKYTNSKLYSLQYNASQDQLEQLQGIVDLTPYIQDLNDTAQLLEHFQIIISVDTAMCHLASSLKKGPKNVFILLPKNCDMRWSGCTSTNFWYQRATLLRQQNLGDWSYPLHQIEQLLQKLNVAE